ncbi:hypothetical protein AU512_14805 [Lonsdalea iberica]|uniref:Uncharacterized protein n=1 Tax=Lonsdalea iberica TaxID=1082703 RepID=A0ABX3XCR8_9GAMM|nr:hypothetical protein AU512_14805 [Lonsdalea iberica]
MLILKNNYLNDKKNYRKETKTKDVKSFIAYIYFIAYVSWGDLFIIFFTSVVFSIFNHYSYQVVMNSVRVIILLYGMMFPIFPKAKSDRLNISMLVMLKLIPIRLYNSLYSIILFK